MASVILAYYKTTENGFMGTINIEEYSSVGTDANREADISDLETAQVTTVDASTSTAAESVDLSPNTRQITVYGVEDHRVSIVDSTAATTYAIVPAGGFRDFGVKPGSTLYYRLDA